MLRTAFALGLGFTALAAHAQTAGGLYGQVINHEYVSPSGTYKLPIPVLAQLGGTITDTADLAIFQDEFSTYITITAIPLDATQNWELDFHGLKGYLAYYFDNWVMPEFKKTFPGSAMEATGVYIPDKLGGCLIAYALLPGGSMFAGKMPTIFVDHPTPVAKRGFLVFIHDGYTYTITTELAEKALEGTAYSLTPAEADVQLRQRLLDIGSKMEFLKPAAAKAPAIAVP